MAVSPRAVGGAGHLVPYFGSTIIITLDIMSQKMIIQPCGRGTAVKNCKYFFYAKFEGKSRGHSMKGLHRVYDANVILEHTICTEVRSYLTESVSC